MATKTTITQNLITFEELVSLAKTISAGMFVRAHFNIDLSMPKQTMREKHQVTASYAEIGAAYLQLFREFEHATPCIQNLTITSSLNLFRLELDFNLVFVPPQKDLPRS